MSGIPRIVLLIFLFFWFDLIGTSIFIVRAERDAYKYNTVVKIRLRSL